MFLFGSRPWVCLCFGSRKFPWLSYEKIHILFHSAEIAGRWRRIRDFQRISCFSRIILVLDAKKCFINNLWKFSLTRMSRLAILTLSESNVVLPFKRICSESLREWCSSGVDNSTKLNNALQLMSTTCLPQMPCKVWDSQRSLLQQNFRHTSWTMRKIIYGFLNIMA